MLAAEYLYGAQFLHNFRRGWVKIHRGFSRGGSLFFRRNISNFNFEMHVIPLKIAFQCTLNTFIFGNFWRGSKILRDFRRGGGLRLYARISEILRPSICFWLIPYANISSFVRAIPFKNGEGDEFFLVGGYPHLPKW